VLVNQRFLSYLLLLNQPIDVMAHFLY